MSVAFTRQLGAEAGVQLNPLRDNSEIPALDNSDQVFGVMMRATRGRIDKPFAVNRGNVLKKLGAGEPVRLNQLNKAWVKVVEALNNGAYECIVQRLTTENAKISYLLAVKGSGAKLELTTSAGAIDSVTVVDGGTGYEEEPEISIIGGGDGAQISVTVVDGVITDAEVVEPGAGYMSEPRLLVSSKTRYSVGDDLPDSGLLFAIKHLDCFNDGISVEYNAEVVDDEGVEKPNSRITLRLRDSEGIELEEFTGSLDPSAKDDFGNTFYLPDIVSDRTSSLELIVGAINEIPPSDDGYGYDLNGFSKWNKSPVLVCFDEGGTGYDTKDYMRARTLLQYTPHNYAYISSLGSESPGLLAQLAQLSFDTNRQFRYDVPGHMTPEQAATFANQLNLGASETAHLIHAYWAPLSSNDPTGVNGKDHYGTSALNVAYACARNAQTNAKGFAPKNYPIAGREFQIRRTGITQTYMPDNNELNLLARAKINPVIYQTYTGGGRYVWYDSLTSAKVESSLKKLIAVAEMSTHIDEAVTRFGKDALQKPMKIAVKRTADFLRRLFEDAETSDWLVPSNEPGMDGRGWSFVVKPNEVKPYDLMDISYWLRYDGTARQIHVTQTLSR